MPEVRHANTLNNALRQFEAAEANLLKLERLWKDIESLIPNGIVFGDDGTHLDKYKAFNVILTQLPKIDDWKPTARPLEPNEIAQSRLDAAELGEVQATVSTESEIAAPGRELKEYRFLLNQKRRELIRAAVMNLIDAVDADIRAIRANLEQTPPIPITNLASEWSRLRSHISQIDTLLGSNDRPPRWGDLQRHLYFAELHDFHDIEQFDWPTAKANLRHSMYGENEPLPVQIEDLSILVRAKPTGPVTRELNWNRLTSEGFERVVFSLITGEKGYENPQWLTSTSAPDRGRDLSVEQVIQDPLAGTTRRRVIIQCKHWQEHSVAVNDIESLQGQMRLWEPPKVDILIIATSGRFTSDAVALVERYNQADLALKILMWPESHLEMLLASRPALIAEFGLR